jgi:hypothetical protein
LHLVPRLVAKRAASLPLIHAALAFPWRGRSWSHRPRFRLLRTCEAALSQRSERRSQMGSRDGPAASAAGAGDELAKHARLRRRLRRLLSHPVVPPADRTTAAMRLGTAAATRLLRGHLHPMRRCSFSRGSVWFDASRIALVAVATSSSRKLLLPKREVARARSQPSLNAARDQC